MKVGIITFHNATNYGGVLQCYALQNCLCKLGYDCEVIDYHNEYIRKFYSPFFLENRSLKKKLYMIYAFPQKLSRNLKFKRFRDERLQLSRKKYTKENIWQADGFYDVIISGSDQVWNLMLTHNDVNYMLPFCRKAKKISYAASFGFSTIPENFREVYSRNLKRFDRISVRERSSAELVYQLVGVMPNILIDPVFLLDESDWRKLIASKKRVAGGEYICVYKINKSRVYELARKLSVETSLPVYAIKPDKTCPGRFHKLRFASPEDFINTIAGAKYVLTDSFHGTAFSILFKKNFVSCLDERKENKNTRIISILRMFGLEQRMSVDDIMQIPDHRDLNSIDNTIRKLKEDAISYLQNTLM